MIELSDWIWLGVIVLWAIFRIVPRMFRSKAAREPRPAPSPATPSSAPAPSMPPGQDRVGDVGPGPINPK